ncbi:MAG: hypothetical protein KGL42_17630, partial [Betaproteobacteria bacterium]|nr:hypothetical protein [Betaproteobacteria bacterium]
MNPIASKIRKKHGAPLRSAVRPALALGGLSQRLKSGIVLFWLLAAWGLSQGASAMTSPSVSLETIPAARATFGPLLTPAQLHAILPQVHVVDIREDDGGPSTYAAGH